MAHHLELVAKAKVACDAVFSDKSVKQSETRGSLEEIKDHIDGMIDTLDGDEDDDE